LALIIGVSIKNLNINFLEQLFQYCLLGLKIVSDEVRIIWYRFLSSSFDSLFL